MLTNILVFAYHVLTLRLMYCKWQQSEKGVNICVLLDLTVQYCISYLKGMVIYWKSTILVLLQYELCKLHVLYPLTTLISQLVTTPRLQTKNDLRPLKTFSCQMTFVSWQITESINIDVFKKHVIHIHVLSQTSVGYALNCHFKLHRH